MDGMMTMIIIGLVAFIMGMLTATSLLGGRRY